MKKAAIRAIIITIFLLIMVQPTWAGEKTDQNEQTEAGLTLNQAIEMAVHSSNAAKKAEVEIERTEALRERASDSVTFTPAVYENYDPAFEAAWAGLLQADLTWQMSKKTYDARLDGITLDVCKQYWEVLKAQEKLKVKSITVEKALLELQKSRAAYQVGMVGKVSTGPSAAAFTGLEQAEANMVKAEGELTGAQNELEQAYIKFNQLTGLSVTERPVLVEQIEFHPLEIADLENQVSRIIDASPSVWLAEQNVELQSYIENLLWATGQYKPYDARKAESKQAELDAANAKKSMKAQIRDLYYTVKNMEETYKSLEKSIVTAEESLRVTELMYEVGMVTKADVVAAKAAVAELKLSLQEVAAGHAYTKLFFQKPWAPMYSTSV